MADYEEPNAPEDLNRGRLAAAAMIVVGGLLALVATVWALARFLELSSQSQPLPALSDFVATAALLLVGWGVGLLLWGAAEMLRRLEELLETLRASSSSIPGADASTPAARLRSADAPPDRQARLLEELVHLTRELREIELLSQPERAARLKDEAEELARQLENEVPALLREHNLEEAQERVRRARRRFPSLRNWDALAEQVEQARAKFEAHDLDVGTREVDDLVALGAWDRATEVVRNLRQRHPASDNVAALARRVTLARDTATAGERARLMSGAQEATSRREWNQALRLVEALLARFPSSPEALELRHQVPTLKANVEVHIRQEREAEIRELIKEQRFAEALRIANDLIERYPGSPQATILRDQLPRLREKAAEIA